MKSFDYDLQAKLDHISDQELQGAGYLNSIFAVLDILAGEKETSERRRVLRAALYEGPRRSDESLAQYALRREAQFMSATPFINIPDDLKAFMLEEQANLSKQSVQNLRVLTGLSSDFRQVLKALRILDTDEEPIAKNKHSSYFESDVHGSNYDHLDDDVSEEEFGLTENEVQGMLDSISQQDLEEDAAMSFVTDWEAKKKRSWSENRAMKNAKKKDRRHFDEPDSRPPKPAAHRGRLSIQELKKVTRCGNCGQKGHWREDCKNPYKPKSDKTFNKNAFVFLGTSSKPSSSWCNFLNYLTIPACCAIVDPGASQDLIGKNAFEKLTVELAKTGLKPVILDESPAPAAGVGGQAKPLYSALTPCFLGTHPGIVKLTVIEEDVPHLLSIGLLEHAKAIIDVDKDEIQFRAFDKSAPMTRLESGHRLLNVVRGAGPFEIPAQVLEEHGLTPDSFRCNNSACGSAYMAAIDRPVGVRGEDSFVFWDHGELTVSIGSVVGKNTDLGKRFYVSGGLLGPQTSRILWVDEPNINKVQSSLASRGFLKPSVHFNMDEHTCTRGHDTHGRISCHTHDTTCQSSEPFCCFFMITPNQLNCLSKEVWTSFLSFVISQYDRLTDHRGRHLDSCDMLRLLVTCYANSISLSSHGIGFALTSGGREEAPKPDGIREVAGSVVHHGVKAASPLQGALQPEDADVGRTSLLPTPQGVCGKGGQPVWPLGKVHTLQNEAQLRGILQRQPSNGVQSCEEQHPRQGHDREVAAGSYQSEQGHGEAKGISLCHSPGDAGLDAPADSGAARAAAPGDHGDANSGSLLDYESEPPCCAAADGRTADANGPTVASAHGGLGAQRGGRGDAHQSKRVGSRGSVALSFLTLASILPAGGAFHTSTCPSSLVASEWNSWFLLPFCKAVHCSSFQTNFMLLFVATS